MLRACSSVRSRDFRALRRIACATSRALSLKAQDVYDAVGVHRPVRILTAVAAYDGHDASILAVNRALLQQGRNVELIYQGFNRCIPDITTAACQEGVDVVALSTYNGGHREFLPTLAKALKEAGSSAVLTAGGGGTITPDDAAYVERNGVKRCYGIEWSLGDVAKDLIDTGLDVKRLQTVEDLVAAANAGSDAALGEVLSLAELQILLQAENPSSPLLKQLETALSKANGTRGKTLFVVGDGGSGKSTMTDALVQKYLDDFGQDQRVAVVCVDPTTLQEGKKSSLLGDRVRMNSIYGDRVFMRSVATRAPYETFPEAMGVIIPKLRNAYDLTIVETPGSGQVGVDMRKYAPDVTVYVKTKEFGTANIQLHKDQLLKDADVVVLNKADREGSRTALAQLNKQLAASGREAPALPAVAKMPRDPGTNNIYCHVMELLGLPTTAKKSELDPLKPQGGLALVPHGRRNYIGRVVEAVRKYDEHAEQQVDAMRNKGVDGLDNETRELLATWREKWDKLTAGRELVYTSYNGIKIPKVAFPENNDVEMVRFLLEEGLPGDYPFVSGTFPLRRDAMDTTRQFAGLRLAEHTNERFHLLANGVSAPRLSTAFDGVTLYGADSDDDPGSLGKVGEGGVAVDSLADMRILYNNFDFDKISTSLTINGPAIQILAMYFNAAAEWALERYIRDHPSEVEKVEPGARMSAATYAAAKPNDVHPEYGLTFATVDRIRDETWRGLRGTVQADILKEVQAQNECIFGMDFSIKMMGDVQEFFAKKNISKFYSVSISGYHIGEAGATPAQELAYTLANGFTYLENFMSRGLHVDVAARNLSWFFRNSHELEWLAAGPVSRKIWAVALKDIYGASPKSQMLKFHTQTSGRALQVAEWDTLNPIRQTLHALIALLNNTNSLHVDSADEACNTPSEKFVRQATMIPNILSFEAETLQLQNMLSGSYGMRHIRKQLQEQILHELELIDAEGGVGPATEIGFHRGRIADASVNYETDLWTGKRPIIGRNVLPLENQDYPEVNLVRPTAEDWKTQLKRTNDFRARNATVADGWLDRLKDTALNGGNVFEELLNTTRYTTLGRTSKTLSKVGGRFSQPV